MRVFTVGHGTRTADELVRVLQAAGVETLVDVRRFPGSRRNPQFNQRELAETLADADIAYRHEVELGGRRSDEPGADGFACLRVPAFRSYAARIARPEWQEALERVLREPNPCVMCAELPWWRCHRRLIAELLMARGHEILHLGRPHEIAPHRLYEESEIRDGRLYLCGELVA